MSSPYSPCTKCNGEMTAKFLDPFQGEEGGVKITIPAMPAVVCAQGHKRFVFPAFAALLMDHVMDEELYAPLPSAVKKGLFTKRYHCSGCGLELPESPTGSRAKEILVEIKHVEPFKVQIEVPVYKCASCGIEQIHSAEETGKLAMKATGHAYRGTDIHPK